MSSWNQIWCFNLLALVERLTFFFVYLRDEISLLFYVNMHNHITHQINWNPDTSGIWIPTVYTNLTTHFVKWSWFFCFQRFTLTPPTCKAFKFGLTRQGFSLCCKSMFFHFCRRHSWSCLTQNENRCSTYPHPPTTTRVFVRSFFCPMFKATKFKPHVFAT